MSYRVQPLGLDRQPSLTKMLVLLGVGTALLVAPMFLFDRRPRRRPRRNPGRYERRRRSAEEERADLESRRLWDEAVADYEAGRISERTFNRRLQKAGDVLKPFPVRDSRRSGVRKPTRGYADARKRFYSAAWKAYKRRRTRARTNTP